MSGSERSDDIVVTDGRGVAPRELLRAIRASWALDTAAPEDRPAWSPSNPARGQCGVTALVVHDHLGGDLVVGEVWRAGERVDFHWWNSLPDGRQIDLTREQFGVHEQVRGGTVLSRPETLARLAEEYRRSEAVALLGPGLAVTSMGSTPSSPRCVARVAVDLPSEAAAVVAALVLWAQQ